MSDYITLLDNVVIASDPNTYLTVKYAYQRSGADMKYKIYCYAKLKSSASYRNDGVSLTLALDGNTVLDSLKWKANDTNSWPLTYTNTFTVKNKISGSTSLYVRCWDSQGATSYDYKKTFTNLIVTDAFPVLGLQSVSTEINKATINIANTITGNIEEYEVAKVSDGTIIKTGTLGSKSGNIELTDLTYNTNYSGIYKIRGYGNGGWGNYLTITSDSFVTKNLPIASSNNFDINSYPIFNLSSSSYLSNIKVDVYNGSSLLFTTEGVFTSLNLDSFVNYKDSVLASQPNLSNIPITIKTKITSNSKDYYLSDIIVDAIINNSDYNPIFNENNISYEDINEKSLNVTGSKYKIIKGISNVKYTITPMNAQGGSIGKSYTIKNGDQIAYADYSTENVTAIINGVLNNSTNISAIDSRNKSTLVNKSFSAFIEYTNPTLISASAIRNNGVDSNLLINLEGVFCVWSGLEKTNTIKHIYYRYYINDEISSLSDLIEITNKTFPSSGEFKVTDYVTNGDYFDIDTKYRVEIIVEDLLGLYVVSTINIPTAKPLIWKDKANGFIGIGKKPTTALDVNGNINASNYLGLWTDINTGFTKGVPNGGIIGQILSKKSNTDYDSEWIDIIKYKAGNGINILEDGVIENLYSYDIGDVIITSTNTDPATTYGGTWELIDKELKSQYKYFTTDNTNYVKKNNISSGNFRAFYNNHSIHIDGVLTVSSDLSDTSVNLATLKFPALGFSLESAYFFVGWSDGGNALAMIQMQSTGIIQSVDVVGKSSSAKIASGQSVYFECSINAKYQNINDSECDKFYWKKTA